MVSIRDCSFRDAMSMIDTNIHSLPENYRFSYWAYHLATWPDISKVAEDEEGNIVGYVLAKIDDMDDPKKRHGHITSLAVRRTYRKLGLATKLMNASQRSMMEVYGARWCSLHVRATNRAAIHLYTKTLKFNNHTTEKGYYADGEDAFEMRTDKFTPEKFGLDPKHIPDWPEDGVEEAGGGGGEATA